MVEKFENVCHDQIHWVIMVNWVLQDIFMIWYLICIIWYIWYMISNDCIFYGSFGSFEINRIVDTKYFQDWNCSMNFDQ